MKKYIFLPGIFLFIPVLTFAQIEITEIMYDLEGSDSKREWIEVFNSGNADIDLTDWRFNDGKNHVFNAPPENGGQGSIVIASGDYAILASDAATLRSEHPGVTVSVIDTVMSLNNTADTLQLKDADGLIVDEVSYSNTLGAAGDGMSLQFNDGQWGAGVPTPGSGTQAQPAPDPEDSVDDDTSGDQEEETSTSGTSWPVEPQIFAFAGVETRSAVVGGTIRFTGDALGLKQEPLEHAVYVWSFGDGARAEGRQVDHTYRHPGTYVVMLDVSSGKYSATDRVYAAVVEADLTITAHLGHLSVANNGNEEIDLSWWQLSNDGVIFTLPQHTIVLAGKRVSFADEVTGLSTSEGDEVRLHYPNGSVAQTSIMEGEEEVEDVAEIVIVEEAEVEPPVLEPIVVPAVTTEPNTSQFRALTDSLGAVESTPKPVVLAQVVEPAVVEVEEVAMAPSTTQVAQVLVPAQEEQSRMGLWLFGVLGIAFLGVLGTLFTKPATRAAISEADSYSIIDESEIDSNR